MAHPTNGGEQQLFMLLVILAVIALLACRRKFRGSGTSHGTARWASEKDLRAAGMLSGRGLILGRTRSGRLIRMPTYCHILLVGGTGSGKGVSIILPQLLMPYQAGSCVCFDTKGDLLAITATRRERLGRVIRLAPFNGGRDAFNPLDVIADGPMLVDSARALAEALVVRQGTEPDPHWNESAVMVICALLVFVLLRCEGEERSLNAVREIASDPALVQAAGDKLRELGGIPARLGNYLRGLKESEKERAGILSTVSRHLAFLDSELVAAAVARSTFDPASLRTPGTTLFVQINPELLEAQRGLLRCWIATLIGVLGRTDAQASGEVLFLLDEASALNGLSALEEALVRGRSAGCRLLLAYQSDSQVRAAFKDKPTLLYDNCSSQIYLGASSYETGERISKQLGNATITVESAGDNESKSWQAGGACAGGGADGVQRSRAWSRNWSEKERALLDPAEVLQMSGDYLIAFLRDTPPILARRVKWYADPLFAAMSRTRQWTPQPLWWLLLAAAGALVAWGALAGR